MTNINHLRSEIETRIVRETKLVLAYAETLTPKERQKYLAEQLKKNDRHIEVLGLFIDKIEGGAGWEKFYRDLINLEVK